MIVKFSAAAEQRLFEVWRLSRARWGEARADKYVTALYDAVQVAAVGRKRPQPRPEISPGLSVVRVGSHHVYVIMDVNAEVLHVVTILHQRMEPRRHIRNALRGE